MGERGKQAFRYPPRPLVTQDELDEVMSEWIARVYSVGKVYRVVVEGLLQFEVDHLEGVEDRSAEAILERVRKSYPTRAKPWADPTAERVMEFEVGVRVAPASLAVSVSETSPCT
jgi:hypothetical protein